MAEKSEGKRIKISGGARRAAEKMTREKKILIVGGGVAGLTCGILLCRAGVRCEIYEKNLSPGGNLTGWAREGVYIDNCIHWLTGTREGTALYKLWEECGALGGSVRILRRRSLYTSFGDTGYGFGRNSISFSRDLDRAEEQMIALSPADEGGVRRFFSAARAVRRAAGGYFPGGRLAEAISVLPYAKISLGELAAGFSHPLLRAAFTDFIPGAYNAAGLLLTYGNFAAGNADLPYDGSLAMAQRMAARFRSYGGILHPGAKVTEILLRDGEATGIRLSDGEEVSGDGVILTCDPTAIFGSLLPQESMPSPLAEMYRRPKAYPVWSALQCALTVRGGNLPFDGTVAFPIRPMRIAGGERTRLTLRAPGFRPPEGGGAPLIECLLPIGGEEARGWIRRRAEDPARYRAEKQEFAEAVAARTEEFFPSLAGRISPLDAWTPATYKRYFGAESGAFMSFALTGEDPRRTLLALAFADSDRRTTPRGLRRIRLAGQWMRLPGGLPSAAVSGKKAAEWAMKL